MSKGKSSGSGPKPPHGKDVVVGPHPDGWEVKKKGNERASAVTDTKAEAEKVGRDMARKESSELIVKRRDGTIERRDSHGHDPNPPKDKK